MSDASGPLAGVRVVELAGMGPAPYGVTVLADLGADVIRIDRTTDTAWPPPDIVLRRGRRSVALDLKDSAHVIALRRILETSDVLVEGFRPGVMERLRLGPADLTARFPRLVYARMTGWGQDGPMAQMAGHDIDYIAIGGVLGMLGSEGTPPRPPLNLVGDFAGGGMFLVAGVLAALIERERSGLGQVIDVAMVDGAAHLVGTCAGLVSTGQWSLQRGTNVVDGGAPYYGCYECADGRYMAVGAIEPKFCAALLAGLGLDDIDLSTQNDRSAWPTLRRRIAGAFLSQPRDVWEQVFAGSDACAAPVLSFDEAPGHAHAVARGMWEELDGMLQATPAPRFGRTPTRMPSGAPRPGSHTAQVLTGVGLDAATVAAIASSSDGVRR